MRRAGVFCIGGPNGAGRIETNTLQEEIVMKLGLFMMPLHPPGRPPAETYDEDLELVRRADRLGFSEIWVGEHMLLEWENMPTPELFIARALGETEQIVFGTGVVLLHFHDPVQVAHRIAMLDHLAKGRFMFGIGSGGTPSDAEMLRIDPDPGAQRKRMMEGIELILSIWENGSRRTSTGSFYSTRKPQDRTEMEIAFHMRPFQQPHPPIAVAGASVRSSTLALAGERGWIPLSASLVHTSQLCIQLGIDLGGGGARRPHAVEEIMAHREAGIRRGDDRAGPQGSDGRGAGPRLHRLLDEAHRQQPKRR